MARRYVLSLLAGVIILICSLGILGRVNLHSAAPWRISHILQAHGKLDINDAESLYLLGVGRSDITGPVVEINLMGYADANQVGTGLRQRLYSRAFIIGDLNTPQDRFVYLVLDTQSGDTAVRHGILEALAQKGPQFSVYNKDNVAVTGTHSHSGPGAWLNYLLPQITSKGFDKSSYTAIVDGAVASIVQAHERLAPGKLSIAETELLDANINRSPYAYLANPEEERARYKHDVDKTMTILRFSHATDSGEKDVGILTWFPVHGTSMLGNNTLITGDNKGVAARLFEQSTENDHFVAGFSQANVGDTSPNVLGAYCESGEQIGQKCDFKTSLCGNKTQPCHGRGPYYGRDDAGTASAYEIGQRQFKSARALFENSTAFSSLKSGVVRSLHRFIDLSNFTFQLQNGSIVRTCPAALGYSFAAGTSDGPGAFDFKQGQPGDPNANPLWEFVRNRIHKPNETQQACHAEKPILLDVGETKEPYEWSPNIVDIQTLRVGNLFIIVAPGEATTMSGRRWKEALRIQARETIDEFIAADPLVVLGGPANTYSHYIGTPEEYTIQRYEGASTLYGPHTLDAYINLTCSSLKYLSTKKESFDGFDKDPLPPINTNVSRSFITPVIVDRAPLFRKFADVVDDVKPSYRVGETVTASFVGANPRNNHRLGETFAAVEKFDPESNTWDQIRDDADWSLVYRWRRTSTVLGTSEVSISWETMWETEAWRHEGSPLAVDEHTDLRTRNFDLKGLFRLRYFGDAKSLGGTITAFEGTSGEFRFS